MDTRERCGRESKQNKRQRCNRPRLWGEGRRSSPPDVPYDTADSDDSGDAPEHGETEESHVHVILTDEHGQPKLDKDGNPMTIPGIEPSELQGRSFLQNEPDGSIRRERIVEQLNEQAAHFATHPKIIKFKVKYDKDELERTSLRVTL